MKLKWKYMVWLIGFLIFSSIIIGWNIDVPRNPVALKNIIADFQAALAYSLIGISMMFNYKAMLMWIENHFRLSLPASRFRFLGCFLFCSSLLLLISSINKFLAYLGIVPNTYAP